MTARPAHHATAPPSLAVRWLRFVLAVAVLALFIGLVASGLTPPGVFGEVLRHNQAEDIDASPLIYTDVEHMHDLEEGVRQLQSAAEQRNQDKVHDVGEQGDFAPDSR